MSAAAITTLPQRLEVSTPQRVEITTVDAEMSGALVASLETVTQQLEQITDVLAKVVETQNADREAFTEALTAAANRPEQAPPVVNVTVPEIVVPQPTVNVHVPKTKLLVPTPVVNVTLPGAQRTVTFQRDPLTGQISEAKVEEIDG